jgi:oligopeptide transport system ATP-binding protein
MAVTAATEGPAADTPAASAAHLLEVRGLRTEFGTDSGVVHAVNEVSFHVDAGEVLAIVGESGSGKSVTMLSVMRLIKQPPGRIVAGEVLLDGRDLLGLDAEQMRRVRGSTIGMIFQEPLTSLNPVFTVGDQVDEAIRAHGSVSRGAARARTLELLAQVNIPDPGRVARAWPHQLSGGMCQRVMLAIALACHPRLLIADEPTTALDITTQAQLLELIRRLQSELDMAVIWITHDLGIVAGLADRVLVMYAGRVVETAPVDELYANPVHPYTQGLLACIPRIDGERGATLMSIPGAPPDLVQPPPGCPFTPRCGYAHDRCRTDEPPLERVSAEHLRACWAPLELLRAVP